MITVKIWRQEPTADVWCWSIHNGEHNVFQDWARGQGKAIEASACWLIRHSDDERLKVTGWIEGLKKDRACRTILQAPREEKTDD
jgi:hypothetical protein